METISPVYARLVLRDLEQHDIDPAPLFRGTRLTRQELLRGGDIALEDFLHILREGHRQSPDGKLGFMLGRNMHVFALGPLGAGMSIAPTLREGLQLLESFNRLHASYMDVDAHSHLEGMTIHISYREDTGMLERFHSETALIVLQQYIESTTGQALTDASYRVSFPEPENLQDYREVIHGDISFGADRTQFDIPRRWLDLPSPYYHAEMWRDAQLTLSRRLAEQGETGNTTFTRHIRALLQTSEPPLPDLAEVAGQLHVSQRTLNRRLQAEGTSYRQLKSEALANWARLYLAQTDDSVEAIGAALGYQDTANFRRAFRKIEHCTPKEYRLRDRSS